MAENQAKSGSPDPVPRRRTPLEQIVEWESLVVEARYSPRGLCALCGFSIRHMQRFVLKHFRMSLHDFVSTIRMTKAYNLLRAGFSVKETALGLGFKQVSHFCRSFKQHFQTNASAILRDEGGVKDGSESPPQLELEFINQPPRRKVPVKPKNAVSPLQKKRKKPKEKPGF